MQKHKWENIIGAGLFLISVVLLGVSAFLCFSTDIWYDELFTMGLGNQPLSGLISITAQDVHPPFYYMIVKAALSVAGAILGSMSQVVVAKLVCILPFLLSLLYAVTLIRKNFGMLTAGLFSFLLLTMPNIADYTVEIRMYGFALFFVIAAMLHAYELVIASSSKNGDRKANKKYYVNWICLSLYALAACYTHYFACVAVCMVYVYLLTAVVIRHRWKLMGVPFLLSTVACVAGYLPWLLTVVTAQVDRVNENYWIQPLSIRTLGGCVKFIFKPFFSTEVVNIILAIVLFVCFSILLVYYIIRDWRQGEEVKRETGFVTGCVWILVGLVAFGFLASFILRPIFVYRYMLPALGVFWLGIAILATRLKQKRALLIPLMLLLILTGLRNYRAFYGEEMWKRVNMEKTVAALSQIPEDAIVLCNFNQTQAVTSYYLPNTSYLWYGAPEELICEMFPNNKGLVDTFSDQAGMNQINTFLQEGKAVYFLGSGNAREELIEKWDKADMIALEENDVLLERYWFKIFRLFRK